jgi:GT2 family glycosyltransferase
MRRPVNASIPVTVVVCSRDRHTQLAEALPAVRAALGEGDRLVVVDSASRDERTSGVARAAGARCVRVGRPGLSRARNAGVREAETEVIAFTDDDCVPSPEWLEHLRGPFADPAVGFVTGRVVDDDGGPGASVLARTAPQRYAGPRDVAWVGHGANMAFRRSALMALGPFDERLGSGAEFRSGEDADMLYRCLEAGWHGVYSPEAVIAHSQWRELRELLRLRYGYGLGNGAYRAKVVRRAPRRGVPLLLGSFKGGLWHVANALRARDRIDLLRALTWIAGVVVGTVRGTLARRDGTVFRAVR